MLLIVQMIYKVLYPDFKDSVAHCIDDLEKTTSLVAGRPCVIHRIDDLETNQKCSCCLNNVIHRIDDLEIFICYI